MQQSTTILVATHNPGKVLEFEALLGDLDVNWIGLDEAGIDWDVEETGDTFQQNAVLKATTYAQATNMLTLADDSGLEVDALGGKPGVYTARFGGEGLSSQERYLLLLDQLKDVPWEKRTARFCCVVALASRGELRASEKGFVEGHITFTPSGSGGFGYDPVFYLSEYDTTMAELPPDIKNRISHRARALSALKPQLAALLAE